MVPEVILQKEFPGREERRGEWDETTSQELSQGTNR